MNKEEQRTSPFIDVMNMVSFDIDPPTPERIQVVFDPLRSSMNVIVNVAVIAAVVHKVVWSIAAFKNVLGLTLN
jgi:hypothetical protein